MTMMIVMMIVMMLPMAMTMSMMMVMMIVRMLAMSTQRGDSSLDAAAPRPRAGDDATDLGRCASLLARRAGGGGDAAGRGLRYWGVCG